MWIQNSRAVPKKQSKLETKTELSFRFSFSSFFFFNLNTHASHRSRQYSNPNMAPNKIPEMVGTHEGVRSSEIEDSDLEGLESELKQMAHKILEYRATLPDQLKSTLLSLLEAQRPILPQPSQHASIPGPFLLSRVFVSFFSPSSSSSFFVWNFEICDFLDW